MAGKLYTTIGFVTTVDDADKPGKWKKQITEKQRYVDVLSFSRRRGGEDSVNGDFKINNKLSILMDPFVQENFRTIAYVEIMGTKWKISDATIAYPRLILTVGGKYNA